MRSTRISLFTISTILKSFLFAAGLFIISTNLYSQNKNTKDSAQFFTLKQCIDYALKHQPLLNQSLINVSIAKTTNAINLSGWYPQVNISANLTHYIQLPTAFIADTANPGGPPLKTRTGIANTVIPELSVTQALFSPSLLFATKTAPLFIQQAQQITDSTKIFIVSSVSKAFYNLLLTLEQINVLKEDTVRLSQNVQDAYHQYVGGIVDETDYEQATITLNNSKAQLRQAKENVVPQYATLKLLMGYQPQNQFNVSFDTLEMMNDIAFDTTQQLQYENRIEFKQLQTSKILQHTLTDYYRHTFLPTVSAFYTYNYEFESNSYSNLYANAYPNSLIGLSLNLPVFTGFSRVKNIQRSKLQENLLDWSEVDLKLQINNEYTSALANYRGNLYNLEVVQQNVEMAKRVYFVVTLQYKQGIVPYLNVITAESNLITSQTSYINALYQVLSSKIDLQKAMGIISY
ncbi:MAG TPA: TolC family protein [Puia sp.]|nr:TolC family protein [Puia sp.]